MAVLMEKDFWINSQLSIARYYGGLKMEGDEFSIVPPYDDLIDVNFIFYYKKLGRDKFIEILKRHPHDSKSDLKDIYKRAIQTRNKLKRMKASEQSLF